MNFTKGIITILVTVFTVMFFLISFITLQLDPLKWKIEDRMMFVFLSLIFFVASSAVYISEAPKK